MSILLPDNVVADRHEVSGTWTFQYLTDKQASKCIDALCGVPTPVLPLEVEKALCQLGIGAPNNTAIVRAHIAAQQKRIAELTELLERCGNGLEWRISTHPTQCDESDSETLTEIKAALASGEAEGRYSKHQSDYFGQCGPPFEDMHKLAEQLLGRPILTHEFGSRGVGDALKEAVRPSFIALCATKEIEP